jgi:dihydrofolate synthase/folylpolyglutamate synthase
MSSPSFSLFMEEKPLYYKEIDHERVHQAYARLKPNIKQPLTIHIVGTNGKGSTGRIMATLLHHSGKRVGHFSSPHILKFNERIWIEGSDSSDEQLEVAHKRLYAILGREMSEALSYFEYTTLLALVAMEELEVIVLEAGLGGEFDATNVCSKSLSVITPIGLDHQDFLGESIEAIATTKINSVNNPFLVALQEEQVVYEVAKKIAKKRDVELHFVKDFRVQFQQEFHEVQKIATLLGWSDYLFENAQTALYALKLLNLKYLLEDLKKVKLFGRYYPLSQNIRVDVGHNTLAAKAIVKALAKEKKRIILVYNALDDKDYATILKIFKPHLKRVEIIEIDTLRAVDVSLLEDVLDKLKIDYSLFSEIEENENYLVFGSFYVVEAFLNKKKQNINLL